jgi:Ferredoxin-dependent bilin reductase
VSVFAFAELVRRIERRLVSDLSLEALPLSPELSALQGTFRGEPATLVARAYAGPRLAYVRFVEVQSRELDIGNVLGLPRVQFTLPVLGIDLVEVGRDTAVVVADLSPMTEQRGERAEQHAALARHWLIPQEASGARLGAASELPDWAREWFSDDALSARVEPGQAGASEVAVGAYVAAFVDLVRQARAEPERAETISSRQRAYAAAHRERDRGLLLLRRMFEPSLADRFLRDVLFPEQVRQ